MPLIGYWISSLGMMMVMRSLTRVMTSSWAQTLPHHCTVLAVVIVVVVVVIIVVVIVVPALAMVILAVVAMMDIARQCPCQ